MVLGFHLTCARCIKVVSVIDTEAYDEEQDRDIVRGDPDYRLVFGL